jgi:hypothetical protein
VNQSLQGGFAVCQHTADAFDWTDKQKAFQQGIADDL